MHNLHAQAASRGPRGLRPRPGSAANGGAGGWSRAGGGGGGAATGSTGRWPGGGGWADFHWKFGEIGGFTHLNRNGGGMELIIPYKWRV